MNIPDEDIGTDILGPLILCGVVDLDWLAIALDHVQYLYRVVGILLRLELHETIALMLIGDLVSRYVHVGYGPALQEQLPH